MHISLSYQWLHSVRFLDRVLPNGLQHLGRILRVPLETVLSVDVGHTETRLVSLIPFEVAVGPTSQSRSQTFAKQNG